MSWKLMIVDDEPWALIGMEEIIDWHAEGFEIVARCSSGTEALEQAAIVRPDVLITDIQMADFTGLELISRIREILPDIQCVTVSAYTDFTMARTAIELSVLYYLIKPLTVEEIQKVLGILRPRLADLEKAQAPDLPEPWILDPADPQFPPFSFSGKWLYAILSETMLPTLPVVKEGSFQQPIRIGTFYGLLTDTLPDTLPDGCGISMAMPDASRPDILIRSAMGSLICGFRYCPPAEAGKARFSVAEAQFYLYEHLRDDISSREVAAAFYLSETYLCDVFKKYAGLTLLNFLRKIRISHAKWLLVNSHLSLGEIAFECGYVDYNYFGRLFKAETGTSPERFRRSGNA